MKKVYPTTAPVNPSTLSAIAALIDAADYCRGAYFWTPSGSASGRRYTERKYSRDKIEWDEGGRHYTARFDVSVSCAHVYAAGTYTRDGKKTTLTAICNSFQRLQAAAGSAD